MCRETCFLWTRISGLGWMTNEPSGPSFPTILKGNLCIGSDALWGFIYNKILLFYCKARIKKILYLLQRFDLLLTLMTKVLEPSLYVCLFQCEFLPPRMIPTSKHPKRILEFSKNNWWYEPLPINQQWLELSSFIQHCCVLSFSIP